MAKKKSKQTAKPKEDKQVMDGLGVSFEEAMKVLANFNDKSGKDEKKQSL